MGWRGGDKWQGISCDIEGQEVIFGGSAWVVVLFRDFHRKSCCAVLLLVIFERG